jgi:hypothetical protein
VRQFRLLSHLLGSGRGGCNLNISSAYPRGRCVCVWGRGMGEVRVSVNHGVINGIDHFC